MRRDGVLFAFGYAGRDAGKNNPAMQDVHDIGPLPVGLYTIEPSETNPKLGPVAMRLTPDPANEMFGRAGFFIHADSVRTPGQASHGCIVPVRGANMEPGRDVREAIDDSGDTALQVVE